MLASVTYVDKENLVLQKLQVLETRQRQIMMQLRSLQTVLSGAKVRGPGGDTCVPTPCSLASMLAGRRHSCSRWCFRGICFE